MPSYSAAAEYDGKDLLDMEPEERAREGVFLAFQYPVEIPGITNLYFLKAAVNAARKHRGEEPMAAVPFLRMVRERAHEPCARRAPPPWAPRRGAYALR